VDLLRQARAAGYFRLPRRRARLEADEDFQALRPRTGFQKFRAALAEKTKVPAR
jgi:hypothetical protein